MSESNTKKVKEENSKQQKDFTYRKVVGGANKIIGVFESIIYNGEPKFLVFHDSKFQLVNEVQGKVDEILLPKNDVPYRPYKFMGSNYYDQIINFEVLYKPIYSLFDTFIDIEPKYKMLNALGVMFSYHQHRSLTTPFIQIIGEPGSGKSDLCKLNSYICYRALYGSDITKANVFRYLGDEIEGQGTIIVDEAHELTKSQLKTFRDSYTQGSVTPRLNVGATNKYEQAFYKTFGYKIFASYRQSYDKAFASRCLNEPMVEGNPTKELSDMSEKDFVLIDNLRFQLLLWRMKEFYKPLPSPSKSFKRRLGQLLYPLLRLSYMQPQYDELIELGKEYEERRNTDKKFELTRYIIIATIQGYYDLGKKWIIPFSNIWHNLQVVLTPNYIEKIRTFETEDFGDVTHHMVSTLLQNVLHGERKSLDINGKTAKVYKFNKDIIKKLVTRYSIKKTELDIYKKK